MDLPASLKALTQEVESHVAKSGWDQPVRLFALVPTSTLLASNPDLTLDESLPLTSVEQELDAVVDLEEFLGTLGWPPDVTGAILVLERIVLPPTVEDEFDGDNQTMRTAMNHPERADVRIVSAVLKTGQTLNAIRQREHDSDELVAISENLVPNLNEQLLATFA